MEEERREWIHRTARSCGYMLRRSYARELRKNQTPAEVALWEALKHYKTGGKAWRRQHIIDRFIVDFVHLEAKLVIEIDGGYHLTPEQQTLDAERDEALQQQGWRVLRFTNQEVLNNSTALAKQLQSATSPNS